MGADVYALSRSDPSELVRATGGRVRAMIVDAADPEVAPRVIRDVKPTIVVLNAGATPKAASLQEHTWESFSTNWDVDVKMAFHWLKAILNEPLAPGSSVVVLSSGAALRGSPLSGGYAGAKATIRFIAEYAAQEAARAQSGIRFATLLPIITPTTGVGRPFVEAYARRQGRSVEEFLGGAPLTPADVGGRGSPSGARPLTRRSGCLWAGPKRSLGVEARRIAESDEILPLAPSQCQRVDW